MHIERENTILIVVSIILIVINFIYMSEMEKQDKEILQLLNKITVQQHQMQIRDVKLEEDALQLHQLQQAYEAKQNANASWNITRGTATAYSPYDDKNGINSISRGGAIHTSTGQAPRPGLMAVDPERIPYGSEIVLIYEDNTIETGIAADTGGALRADSQMHIDVFRHTYSEAIKHGKKPVQILWR